MCDYSLEVYRSRPAQLGERYETHEFGSLSIGFIAPGDPSIAVCMACDTTLRLEGIPEWVQRATGVSCRGVRRRINRSATTTHASASWNHRAAVALH